MLKYRIFDKLHNLFCEEPDYRWLLSRKGLLYNSENDEWHTIGERFFVDYHIFMTDKNGVELYTNDICKVQLPLGGFWGNVVTEKIGVVEYNTDLAGYIIRWKYSKNQHYIEINSDLDIEIIGNIYENSDISFT